MKDILTSARNPVVFLSGGKDSLVVLDWARKIRVTPVITFNQNFTERQWSIIEKVAKLWSLEIYTFPPKRSYLIPNGKNLARVDEYGLGDLDFPVIRDFVHSDRCALELDEQKFASYPWGHDVIFTGSKKCDSSFATGPSPFKEAVMTFGNVTFCQPLFGLSDSEVRERAKGLPYSTEFYDDGDETMDTGNLISCSRCLSVEKGTVHCPKDGKKMKVFEWDRTASLSAFRTKFGFNEVTI